MRRYLTLLLLLLIIPIHAESEPIYSSGVFEVGQELKWDVAKYREYQNGTVDKIPNLLRNGLGEVMYEVTGMSLKVIGDPSGLTYNQVMQNYSSYFESFLILSNGSFISSNNVTIPSPTSILGRNSYEYIVEQKGESYSLSSSTYLQHVNESYYSLRITSAGPGLFIETDYTYEKDTGVIVYLNSRFHNENSITIYRVILVSGSLSHDVTYLGGTSSTEAQTSLSSVFLISLVVLVKYRRQIIH